MTTDYKVTELFCIINEFCKHFDAENAGNLLEDNSGVKRRRRAASLSDSEIMTILLYFHFGMRIPTDTRSPIPVISVQSVGDLQYRWQS